MRNIYVIILYLFLLLLVSECRIEGRVGDGRPQRRHGGQLERLRTHQPECLVLNLQLWRVVCHFLVISVKSVLCDSSRKPRLG